MPKSIDPQTTSGWSDKAVCLIFLLGILAGGLGAGAGMIGSVIAIEGAKHVFGAN